jgi:hypothetical protein
MPLEVVAETPQPVDEPYFDSLSPNRPQLQSLEFLGAEFAVADKVGLMPLLRFAHAAKSGLDSADLEGMAAMYDMLRQCISDEAVYVFKGEPITKAAYGDLPPEALSEVATFGGWNEFEAHATKVRAGDEDLMGAVQRVMEMLTQRPTTRPSDSSAGPQSTAPISAEDSSALEVVRRLKSQGRSDLAMAVLQQQTG